MKLLQRIDQIEAKLNVFDQTQILDTILHLSRLSNSQIIADNKSSTTLEPTMLPTEQSPQAPKNEKLVLHLASGEVTNHELGNTMTSEQPTTTKLSPKTPTVQSQLNQHPLPNG